MLGSIKGAVSSAKDAVSDVASKTADVGRAGKDVVGRAATGANGLFDRDIFEFDTLKNMAKGVGEVMTGQRTIGDLAGSALDSMGLPDWATDFAAAAIDGATLRPDASLENILSGAAGLAEKAGAEGLSSFLETAGDVSGMATSPGSGLASSVASGGVDKTSLVARASQSAELGSMSELASRAGDIAGQVDTAVDTVGALSQGDLVGAGTGVFDLVGNEIQGWEELLGDAVNSDVSEALQQTLQSGREITAEVLDQYASLQDLSAMDIVDRLDLDLPELDAAVELRSVVDFALEIAEHDATEVGRGIGTELFGSQAGQALVDMLIAAAEIQADTAISGLDVGVEAMVTEATDTARGFLNVADFSTVVARDIVETLEQMGSISDSAQVCEMVGTQVRV